MKKITGWVIIILCSFLLFIFLNGMIWMFIDLNAENSAKQMSFLDVMGFILGYGIIIMLFILGINFGIKKVKKEKSIVIVEFNETLAIKASGQITYKDYRNLIFGLSYKKPSVLLGLGVVALMSLTMLSKGLEGNFAFFMIGLLILSTILTLSRIKKLYDTNKLFQEKLDYQLTNESIQIKGSAVDSIQKWTNFYKIKESGNFFMLYQGEQIATLLDKKMLSNNEVEQFRRFINSLNVIRR